MCVEDDARSRECLIIECRLTEEGSDQESRDVLMLVFPEKKLYKRTDLNSEMKIKMFCYCQMTVPYTVHCLQDMTAWSVINIDGC